MTTTETATEPVAQSRSAHFVDRLMRAIDALPPGERYGCASAVFYAASDKRTPAAIQSLTELLPDIRRITWSVEYIHDDAGSIFPYLESTTLVRMDGTEVTLGILEDCEYDELVGFVKLPDLGDGTQSDDPNVRGLANLVEFDDWDGEEDCVEGFLKLLAGFTGAAPATMAATLTMLQEAAFATFNHSQEEFYDLR